VSAAVSARMPVDFSLQEIANEMCSKVGEEVYIHIDVLAKVPGLKKMVPFRFPALIGTVLKAPASSTGPLVSNLGAGGVFDFEGQDPDTEVSSR
jgi:hypothetical protein